MARKKLIDVEPRTIRVHIPTYNAILEFFAKSNTGMYGSDAIRQILTKFGQYCDEQTKAGRTASSIDLKAAEELVYQTMGDTNADRDTNPK